MLWRLLKTAAIIAAILAAFIVASTVSMVATFFVSSYPREFVEAVFVLFFVRIICGMIADAYRSTAPRA